MKIIKPLRLAMLTRPFTNDQRHWLAVTVIAMTDTLGRDARLIPEPHCWQTFGEELGGEAPFDLAMPKARPEFLVSGQAYTAHQDDKTQCAVSVRLGPKRKDLLVFGNRFWNDGRASPPQAFDSLRIDWRHAYGGPAFAENSIGIGHGKEQVNGLDVRLLPNVEHPAGRVHRPDQATVPAGFGPVDLQRPSRANRLGRQYDEHWQQHLFPGFAKDMDWHYFNAAPEDQWLAPEDGDIAGADFEIWNMHPDHPVLRGKVPDWRARCIVVRGPINSLTLAEGTLDDVPMRLSTAWFFPHLERMSLIYHGVIPVGQDDAADITHAMIAMEDAAQPPRDLAAWRDLLSLRCESEDRALYGMFDELLMPESIIGPWPEVDAQFEDSPLRRNMKVRAALEREKARGELRAAGFGPADDPLPDSPMEKLPTSLRELPAYIQKGKDMIEEQRQKLEEGRRAIGEAAQANAVHSRQAGFDTSKLVERAEELQKKGPPKAEDWARIESMLRRTEGGGYAPSAQQVEQMRKLIETSRATLLESYRRTAHMQDAADAMTPEQAQRARADVERILAGTRDFSDLDLTGADLSNMDLRNARWHRALLESADLSGSVLDNGDMQDAVLTRARLEGTSLRGVNLALCNFALARCSRADFTGASFNETVLAGFAAESCDFTQAEMAELDLPEATLTGCSFERARLSVVTFDEGSMLSGLRFTDAHLHKVAWIECKVADLAFSGAHLDTCDWTETDCSNQVDFSDASVLSTCFVDESHLSGANFQGAVLIDCNLREINIDGADFRDARLDNTDFSDASMRGAMLAGADASGAMFVRTDLTGASLIDANLIDADLQKAILVAADFHRANLFMADLSQCLIDDTTRFDEAYTLQVITTPRRREKEQVQKVVQ
ncbi:hypothetical protein ASC78_02655 [Variovorax sp. Root318D1]|uniref:DUF2169 family type VI secretion system accessory protein n=1 Tax=Variovorax sp. Root318D1 TaxID=1736513 RepID=UPI0006FA9023|nr:DUF2169 domain-containing protein [Variovorax sp. Root318D1]KQU86501.1 hypothetical protein ASC78_02655 [Variovorax sp. Root318D1]